MFKCFCGSELQPLVQKGRSIGRFWHSSEIQAKICTQCGYVGFEPPDEKSLDDYYNNVYGKNAQSWYNLRADYDHAKVTSRANSVQALLNNYISLVDNPVTLEIGCAFGGTVHELRKRQVAAFGVDLNCTAINEGRLLGNEYIFCKYPQALMEDLDVKTNAIYSYHALEHIIDPCSFLGSLHKVLADEAILEFRVPNGSYLKAWINGFDSWDWFAYPDHLHLLSPYSVWHLAENSGYDVLDIKSDSCGESFESMDSWLKLGISSDYMRILQRSLSQSLMLQELRFHLTPKGSSTSTRYKSLIEVTTSKCLDNLSMEADLKLLSTTLSSN